MDVLAEDKHGWHPNLSNSFFLVEENKYCKSPEGELILLEGSKKALEDQPCMWIYTGKALHAEGIPGAKEGGWKEQVVLEKGKKFILLLRDLMRDQAGVRLVKARQRKWPHFPGKMIIWPCVPGIHWRVLTRDWQNQKWFNDNYVAAKWEVNFTERERLQRGRLMKAIIRIMVNIYWALTKCHAISLLAWSHLLFIKPY